MGPPPFFFMADPENQTMAMEAALRLLAASTKSSRELGRRLSRKGFDAEVVEKTLTALQEKHLLDDRQFALELVNRYQVTKPSGKRKIAFELKRRGIDAGLCDELLEALDEEDEAAGAESAARKRWDRFQKLELQPRKKKVYDFLIQRGFDFGVASRVVNRLEKEDEDNAQ